MRPNSLHTLLARRYWLAGPLLVLILYLLTMPRTVTFEDDGLFLMAGYFAGIAHPPGYPLYSLLAAPAALLPIGTVPMRLHALSALGGALACLLVAWIVRRLIASDLIALLAALACGCSAVFWSQAIIAEVYTLNALFVFSLIALALPADDTASGIRDPAAPVHFHRPAGLIAFLFGLSLTLHWPLVVLSMPALCLLFWPQRQRFAAHFPGLILLFCLGLTPYLWMILRSHGSVPVNFYGPIESLHDFWFMVSRQGYIGVDISATASLADKTSYAWFLAREIFTQYSVPGFALVVWGFVSQWRLLPRRLCAAFTLLFLCHSVVFLLLIHFDYDDLSRAAFRVYPLIAYAVMSIWFAFGLHGLSRGIARRFQAEKSGAFLAAGAGTLVVVLLAAQNLEANNRSDDSAARDYAQTLLENLPDNAELFVSGDIATFVPGYLHHVERSRPDVTIYSLDGIVFSNRLFHPQRTPAAVRLEIFNRHAQRATRPICTTEGLSATVGQADHWLFTCIDREAAPGAYRVELGGSLTGYYRQVVTRLHSQDAWTRFQYQRLLRRAGHLSGRADLQKTPDGAAANHMAALPENFYFVLGWLDAQFSYSATPGPVKRLVDTVNRINQLPPGAKKSDIGRFLALRAQVAKVAGDPGQSQTPSE